VGAAKSGWQASNKRDKSGEMAFDHRVSGARVRSFRARGRAAAFAADDRLTDESLFRAFQARKSQEKASRQA
jgi:hypothetical protein